MNKKNKYIVVLLGGWSGESDVSRSSGKEVYKSLESLGYKVTKLEFDREVATKLQKLKPDVVFNALHGTYGEDGKIQGLLDVINIPYTHSGVLASSVCMNKIVFRKICKCYDILVPPFDILSKGNNEENHKIINKIKKPFVIKPVSEGSSIGVEVILQDGEFDIENYHWNHGDEMIIEKYIKGKELNVAVINDKAVGAIQVIPRQSLFYDYASKYTVGMTDYVVPKLNKKDYDELMTISEKVHKMVGCKDISRVEFLQDENDGKFYLLEINTHPGITPLSLVPKIAKNAGISFDEIIDSLIKNASCNT